MERFVEGVAGLLERASAGTAINFHGGLFPPKVERDKRGF
jgi:hypothetical protein